MNEWMNEWINQSITINQSNFIHLNLVIYSLYTHLKQLRQNYFLFNLFSSDSLFSLFSRWSWVALKDGTESVFKSKMFATIIIMNDLAYVIKQS